jgi:hypothetical protein
MIAFNKLKFGDKVYIAKEENHVFAAKRIVMVDADGIEWYRYDRDRWVFSVEELTYCGTLTFIEEGEIRPDSDRHVEHHFKHPDGEIYPESEETDIFGINFKEWFHTREEAEVRIVELKNIRGT